MSEEEVLRSELLLAFKEYKLHVLNPYKWKIFQYIFLPRYKFNEENDYTVSIGTVDNYLLKLCKKLGYFHRECCYSEYNCVRYGCSEETLNIAKTLFNISNGSRIALLENHIDVENWQDTLLEGLENRMRKRFIDEALTDI